MHSRAGGSSQGRPEGDEAAELWPCSPGSSPIVRQRQTGGAGGSWLPFYHAVSLPLLLLVLALLACL